MSAWISTSYQIPQWDDLSERLYGIDILIIDDSLDIERAIGVINGDV